MKCNPVHKCDKFPSVACFEHYHSTLELTKDAYCSPAKRSNWLIVKANCQMNFQCARWINSEKIRSKVHYLYKCRGKVTSESGRKHQVECSRDVGVGRDGCERGGKTKEKERCTGSEANCLYKSRPRRANASSIVSFLRPSCWAHLKGSSWLCQADTSSIVTFLL